MTLEQLLMFLSRNMALATKFLLQILTLLVTGPPNLQVAL